MEVPTWPWISPKSNWQILSFPRHLRIRKIPVTIKVTGTSYFIHKIVWKDGFQGLRSSETYNTLLILLYWSLRQVIICLKKTLRPHREGPIYGRVFWRQIIDIYLLRAWATSTAHATVHPTIGLLPIPRKPIISTRAGNEDEPANCASECIRPMVSVRAWVIDTG